VLENVFIHRSVINLTQTPHQVWKYHFKAFYKLRLNRVPTTTKKKDTRKQRAEQLELLRRQLKNTVKFKVTNRKPQIEGKLFLAWVVDKVIEIPRASST